MLLGLAIGESFHSTQSRLPSHKVGQLETTTNLLHFFFVHLIRIHTKTKGERRGERERERERFYKILKISYVEMYTLSLSLSLSHTHTHTHTHTHLHWNCFGVVLGRYFPLPALLGSDPGVMCEGS